jgi:hypothetical protein
LSTVAEMTACWWGEIPIPYGVTEVFYIDFHHMKTEWKPHFFLHKCLFKPFDHFKLDYLSFLSCKVFFNIFLILDLSNIQFSNIFLFSGLSFYFLDSVFEGTEAFF